MRLWSLHPRYLDPKGLVALWREALLAQAVLAGRTRGYRNHPQLIRFRESSAPGHAIAAYLREVQAEAVRRGYHFDASKVDPGGAFAPLAVTAGQLEYEWTHLAAKLQARAPEWLRQFRTVRQPEPHPLFQVVLGGIADWEIVPAKDRQNHGPDTLQAKKSAGDEGDAPVRMLQANSIRD